MAERAHENSDELKLFEREHWFVKLHPKQTYLGRGVAVLKRPLENPLLCSAEEHTELWQDVLPLYERLVTEAFEPVRVNYAHLANQTKQVHWHLVPRYEDPAQREFAGVEFEDVNIGHNFAPAPEVPAGVTKEVVQQIRRVLIELIPK